MSILATTKRLPKPPKTHTAVTKLIRYVLNPAKTTDEECLYVNSCNCSLIGAANQFKAVRDRWDKNSGNYAYHFIQSFKPGETTPDEAALCGKELADTLFGSLGYQVVIGTHLDKAHLHNHFVANTVNLIDGRKLQTDHDFIRRMREENDRICKAHNLSVIEAPTDNGKSYAEWIIAHNGGFTWRGMIRSDIDELVPRVTTFKELLKELERNGYTVNRRGKYLSLCPPGAKVNFRLHKLGKGYTEEDIAERIMYSDRRLAKESKSKPFRVRVKAYRLKSKFPVRSQGKLRGLYYVYLYRLRKLINSPTYSNVPIQARHDTKLFKEFTEDATLLFDSKIDTVEQLLNLYHQLDKNHHKLCVKRLSLRRQLTCCDSVDVAKSIQSQIAELNPLIQRLGNQKRSCERIYERSARISETNREISVAQREVIKNENIKTQDNSSTKSQKNERNDNDVSRS